MLRLTSTILTALLCLSLLAQDKIKVACVGNSITYGYGTANPETDSYPAQLQVLLGDAYEVGNFGRSGATLLYHGHRPYVQMEEFQKALAFKGDIVVMHLGVNDTDPRDWPLYRDEFIPDYMALIDSFRVARPNCRILISRLSPLGVHHHRFESGTRDWEWEIQEAIAQIAQNKGVELIDFHSLLYPYPNLIEDNIHPNKQGLGVMAHYVKQVLTGDFGGLQVPALFTDHMVLQHGRELKIHGTANAGSTVVVSLHKPDASTKKGKKKAYGELLQQVTATANQLGQWEISLQPIPPGGPYTLAFSDGKRQLAFQDVLAGEVWLCSGQSNMAFTLQQDEQATEAISQANRPQIRLYDLKGRWATNDVEWEASVLDSLNALEYYAPTTWKLCTPETAKQFSAVGYYFGKELADSLQIPIGLICNAVGGAGTEAFIDRKTLEFEFPAILRNWKQNDFIQDWVQGRSAKNVAKSQNKFQRHPYEPCYLFESGILPLANYPIQGVIWYQGESNAHNWDTHTKLFQLLVQSWRNYWENPELPFYYVQLSSLNRPTWTWFRDSQRRLMDLVPHTGMAVSHDVGNETDVHPRQKAPVGKRLARWALSQTYGKKLTPSGPLYQSKEIQGSQMVLHFTHAQGLHGENGEALRGFEIAGDDGLFYPAEVQIQGEQIRVWNEQVKHPKTVRYAWKPYTTANLVNGEELPASTFITD